MALTNSLKPVVDLPVWEWLRFIPTQTAAGSATCTSDDGTGRYIYHLTSATVAAGNFWRYDTITDGWQQLASTLLAASTAGTLKYSMFGGYRGSVLASSVNTITIPAIKNNILKGYKVRIMSGKGVGQERTITSIADPIVADSGFCSTGSTLVLNDTLKKWKVNQWAGYQCRIIFGTGVGQVRKILYNTATQLVFQDSNYQMINPWGNTALITAVGANSIYQIESSVVTVNTNWDVQPDISSTFCVLSGGIWYLTTAGTPGWSHLSFYDIASDVWYPKTTISGNIPSALATDFNLERTGESAGAFHPLTVATNAGSNTARTFTDTAQSWTVDKWVGYQLRIMAGNGIGQRRRIVGNTATKLTVEKNFDVVPGATNSYAIYGNTERIYMTGNGAASILGYQVEKDIWIHGDEFEAGIANVSAVTPRTSGYIDGQESIGITSITYSATGILTVAVNAPGSNYVVGDVVTLSTSGSGGTAVVTGVTTGGAVSALELMASGSGYSNGSSATSGGTGTSLTITITVGKVGNIVTAINLNFITGESVNIAGALTDTSWNGLFTIIGVGSASTFSIANPSGTASATFATASNTVLYDSTKNWTANEHTGRLLTLYDTAGVAPAITSAMRIASNTNNSITAVAALSQIPTNGVSRYTITDIASFGRDEQYVVAGFGNTGYATAGSPTTLTDSTKTWNPSQWVGYKVRMVCGTGLGNESVITANTATQLTVASWGVATPDTTSKYIIMDNFGIATSGAINTINDTTKNWKVNALAGKRIRISGGPGIGNELVITSNTATQITLPSQTPTSSTTYTILSPPGRGTGSNVTWLTGTTAMQKGKYMLVSRGGATPYFDLYNINTGTWDVTYSYTPQTETFSLGTMFAYDGADRLYINNNSTNRVYYLDLTNNTCQSSGYFAYGHSTAITNNRMEIIQTADGLKYLYLMRNSGTEFWRTLLFW